MLEYPPGSGPKEGSHVEGLVPRESGEKSEFLLKADLCRNHHLTA